MALTQASEDGLKISNAPSNGKFLQYKDDTDKLTWADAGGASSIADDSIEEVKLKVHADPSGTNKFLGYTSNGLEWAVPIDTTYNVQDGQLSQNNFTDNDHAKLDGIAASANNYAHPTTAGNKHVPTGGSADQFLKYDSSGTAVWAGIPAGGNTTELVADGAIAAGKPVQIKTNGKVEEVKSTKTAAAASLSTNSSESLSTGNNDGITWSVTTHDPDANVALAYFRGNDGDISYSTMQIGSSNGQILDRLNAKQKVDSTSVGEVSEYRQNWSACYDTTNNKHLVVWKSNSDNKLRCKVGTMSGTTASWANLAVVVDESAGTLHVAFDSGTGRVILVYRRNADGSPHGIVGSYNSTSGGYDWGTAAEIQDVSLSDDCIVVKAGTTTGHMCAIYGTQVGNMVKAHLLTISSSANSFTNAGIDEVVGSSYKNIGATYDANADRIVLIGRKSSDSKPYIARIKRKDNNSGMEADGSLLEFYTQDPTKDMGCMYSAHASRCYAWSRDPSNSHEVVFAHLTNTTGTPTISSPTSIGNITRCEANSLGRPAYHEASGRILYASDYDTNNRAYMMSVTTTTDTSNQYEGGKRVIGFAPSAISDGATGTINTDGNTIDNQSGLTVGTRYYVQDDGSLGVGTSNGSGVTLRGGGLALSASKILIRYKHE